MAILLLESRLLQKLWLPRLACMCAGIVGETGDAISLSLEKPLLP